MTLGNHDHNGDVQYQLDYSQQSWRWKLPSQRYTFTKALPSGRKADFVVFDYYPLTHSAADDGWAWIESSLAGSTADYLFVVTHYPVYSVCSHGSTSQFVSRLRPLLQAHRVTAFVSGHDHCLLHMREGGVHYILSGAGSQAMNTAPNLGNIGAGLLDFRLSRENRGHYEGGFVSITLTDEAAVARYFGDDGTELFSSVLNPPRSRVLHNATMV